MDIVDVQKKSVNFATNVRKDKIDAISDEKTGDLAETVSDEKSAALKGTKSKKNLVLKEYS